MSIKIDINGPVLGMSRPVWCFQSEGDVIHVGPHDSWERAVIVCSCNVLSDSQVRSTIARTKSCARLKHVYASLCCTAKCGAAFARSKRYLRQTLSQRNARSLADRLSF